MKRKKSNKRLRLPAQVRSSRSVAASKVKAKGLAGNRIDHLFATVSAEERRALICFITAGDPTLARTLDLALALEDAGADLLELGMPFSDPMADGPVIQRSSERALRNGVHLRHIFSLVAKIRRRSEIPILLMGYFNPVLHYGLGEFARDLQRAGGDAALIVDLPPEEAADLQAELKPRTLHEIFLLAPTSDEERMKKVASAASGFIYYVALEGVTGAKLAAGQEKKGVPKSVFSAMASQVKAIRRVSALPVAVGFGVRQAEQVREIGRFADGVVVGSALIQKIEEARNFSSALRDVKKFVGQLRRAAD